MSSRTPSQRESLRFFGKISASVSHEIKNVFAVINEAAGLLEDLTLMADKGMPIEPERLKRVAKSVQGQVQRGDGIVKNFNAFAHSTDEDAREVDLREPLGLIVALSTRMADMKQMGLEMGQCESTVTQVSLFELMRLLHAAFAAIMEIMSQGEVLSATVKPTPEGATFTLAVAGKMIALTPDEEFLNMAQQIGATILNNEENGTLELHLKR